MAEKMTSAVDARKALLPSYLSQNEIWNELIELVQEAWGDRFDLFVQNLVNVRDMYYYKERDAGRIHSENEYEIFAKSTAIAIAQLLGFSYPNFNNSLFKTTDYMRLTRNIGLYFQNQGNNNFLEFFSYCADLKTTLDYLWTRDYATFISQEQLLHGDSILDGGEYYPSTHVQIKTESSNQQYNNTVADFFDAVAPLNLVLYSVLLKYAFENEVGLIVAGGQTISAYAKSKLYVL